MVRNVRSDVRQFTTGVLVMTLCLGAALRASAQGPREAYYYRATTVLPWARASVYQQGGSRMTVPFLPVVDSRVHAPFGTGNLRRDVQVDGSLVFVGDGIVNEGRNAYFGRRADYTEGEIDVSGKVVLLAYDAPDANPATPKEYQLGRRIAEAAGRKAAAVVVFSTQKEYPFPSAVLDGQDAASIPAIAVTLECAIAILESAGYDGRTLWKEWEQSKKPPISTALISRMTIRMAGRFETIDTGGFVLRYLPGSFPKEQMAEIAATNERALTFLRGVFSQAKDLQWKKLVATYFRDYDSKIFYTHHWGRGWATPEGTYLVDSGDGKPAYPLAVHENAHVLIGTNWGDSSSFLGEGIGKYVEALASHAQANDRTTIEYIASGRFFRLSEMLGFVIGRPGLQTDVGYPAAGSFVGFVIKRYGLAKLKEIYVLEGRAEKIEDEAPWHSAFGKTIREIEAEWLEWLASAYPAQAIAIRRYLASISS